MRQRPNDPAPNGSAFHTPIHGCVGRPVRSVADDVLPRASRSCSHTPAAAGTAARGHAHTDGHQQVGNTEPGAEPEWRPEPKPERVERSTVAVSVHANADHANADHANADHDSDLAPPNKFDDVRWFAAARLTKHVDGCPSEPVDGECDPLRGFGGPSVGLACRVYTAVTGVPAGHSHRKAQVGACFDQEKPPARLVSRLRRPTSGRHAPSGGDHPSCRHRGHSARQPARCSQTRLRSPHEAVRCPPSSAGGAAECWRRRRSEMGVARLQLVEDDEELLRLLVRLLSADGYRVTPAADGQRGLHLGLAHDFDVVVLDRSLPGLERWRCCGFGARAVC